MTVNRAVLGSWTDGSTKDAVVGFITESATEGSPGFIPEAERVAAFDNDGTLWVERPAPPQVPFLHDDAEREYAYTDAAESLLEEAKREGWTVASMKDDWTEFYGGA